MIRSKNDLHPCRGYRLGVMGYDEALRLQNNLTQARLQKDVGDTLLLMQHPPVITMGKSGKAQNVLAPQALREKNIPIIHTDRGGDVTYHGPGQLVVYPILDLQLHGLSVHAYVWNLEEVSIRVLARYGIIAGRVEKLRGVWLGQEKICSLGVHLSHWISKHGLALNVNNDLSPFSLINPCGTGRPMTSMTKILGWSPDMEEIESLTLRAFAEVFGFSLREEPTDTLEPYR
jgi:lipoyl(octanoyl) transferase